MALSRFKHLHQQLLMKCGQLDQADGKSRASVYKNHYYILQEVHERISSTGDADWSDETDDEELACNDETYVTSSLRIEGESIEIYDHFVKAELPRPSKEDHRQ